MSYQPSAISCQKGVSGSVGVVLAISRQLSAISGPLIGVCNYFIFISNTRRIFLYN